MAAPGGSGTDEVEVEALAFVKEIENRSSQVNASLMRYLSAVVIPLVS
jgi:hypothetical protein